MGGAAIIRAHDVAETVQAPCGRGDREPDDARSPSRPWLKRWSGSAAMSATCATLARAIAALCDGEEVRCCALRGLPHAALGRRGSAGLRQCLHCGRDRLAAARALLARAQAIELALGRARVKE